MSDRPRKNFHVDEVELMIKRAVGGLGEGILGVIDQQIAVTEKELSDRRMQRDALKAALTCSGGLA
jgi:hypothetical protein